MYTSAEEMRPPNVTRRGLWKGAAIYGAIAAFCILLTNVYALFGHGVRSPAMDWMFLYPLAGAVIAFVLGLSCPQVAVARSWPAAKNLFSAGCAVLAMGALLRGILDIAGTASGYLVFYAVAGWLCVCGALAAGLVALLRRN